MRVAALRVVTLILVLILAINIRNRTDIIKKMGRNPVLIGRLYIKMYVVNDPPATMDSDSLTSEVQYNWRRRQIGRPGKEDRAMVNIPRIKKIDKNSFWVFEI